MSYPKRLFIADVSGPPGALDEVGAWCKSVAEELSSTRGIDRVGRYRKLNDVRTLIAADVDDDSALTALAKSFSSPPTSFSVATAVATQRGEQRRVDAIGDARECPLFYTVGFPVPAESMGQLGEWYDAEHAPMLLRCPYWIMTRRFHIEQSATQYWGSHLAIHYLSDIRALRSPERDEARQTAWRDRLAAQPWFRGKYNICLQES